MALGGLDERIICFTKGGNGEHVRAKVLEAFPTLGDLSYQILQTKERSSCQLLVLTIPPDGYTVCDLKSIIASAKSYIKPYQKDIGRQQCCFEPRSNSGSSTSGGTLLESRYFLVQVFC